MEPLETPVKDGILYQQHIKFGKVGTLAARRPPRTGGGPMSQTQTGHSDWEKAGRHQGGESNLGVEKFSLSETLPHLQVASQEQGASNATLGARQR